jgi:hypothetical protein
MVEGIRNFFYFFALCYLYVRVDIVSQDRALPEHSVSFSLTELVFMAPRRSNGFISASQISAAGCLEPRRFVVAFDSARSRAPLEVGDNIGDVAAMAPSHHTRSPSRDPLSAA